MMNKKHAHGCFKHPRIPVLVMKGVQLGEHQRKIQGRNSFIILFFGYAMSFTNLKEIVVWKLLE